MAEARNCKAGATTMSLTSGAWYAVWALERPRRRLNDNIKMDVKSFGKAWTGLIWLKKWTMAGSCKHDTEPSGSIKGGGYLD